MTTHDPLTHERILASAGSGKTWELSSRYLRLVNAGCEPSGILASTFTRLAAGEIRDRILKRLADAVEHDEQRAELAEALHQPGLQRDDAMQLVVSLARRVHEMNIRTLDSFFAAIVAGFSMELGIPAGCRIVDEDEGGALRAEAIRRLLDERDPQPLVEALRLLTRGDPERSIVRTIDRVVQELYSISLETDATAWSCLPQSPVPEFDHPRVGALTENLCSMDVPRIQKWVDAHTAACRFALGWNWRDFLTTGIAKAVLKGKTRYASTDIPPFLLDAYSPLVDHARAAVINLYRQWNQATHDLLDGFREQYDALKRERRVLTFSDLTNALDRADSLGTLDQLCYRIDHQLDHVLLDEFQDTSIPQWRALQPNLHELVSDETTGRTIFCVGDLKQSIYEWRDASPEILDNLPELLFGEGAGEAQLPSRPLDVSYRSAQPIIDCVNSVFADLATSPALDKYPDVAAAWAGAFSEHSVAKKNEKLPGYAQLRSITPIRHGRKVDGHGPRMAATIELIDSLRQRAPGCTIGILTRRNDTANELLVTLQRRGIPVAGPGGSPLTDVAVVNVVLDLLQLAECPEDTAAAFHVARSALGPMMEFEEWNHAGHRRALSRRVRRRVYEAGFAPFVASLVPPLASSCGPRELRRLVHLVDVAESVDRTGSRDLTGLVRVVEARAITDPRPAPVQVLTIHKAKGLEFDIVILPELGSPLAGHGGDRFAYERDGVTGPITRITRPIQEDIREELAKLGHDIEPLFDGMVRKRVRESLSMLYVAMTRAKTGLYMIVDPPRITRKGEADKRDVRTTAGVVWSALSPDRAPGDDEIIAEFGDPDWLDRLDEGAEDAQPPEEQRAVSSLSVTERIALTFRGGPAPRSAASPSQAVAGARLRSRLVIPDREATDRGTAIHALFEQITWIEEFEASVQSDAALAAIVHSRLPRRTPKWIADRVREFHNALKQSTVRDLLSNPSGDDIEVWRERPFARQTETGLQQGVVDRLEIVRDTTSGSALSARIIDYKTDAVNPGSISKIANDYLPQLHAYRDAVMQMLKLPPEAITLVLAFVPEGRVWQEQPASKPASEPSPAEPETSTDLDWSETLFD